MKLAIKVLLYALAIMASAYLLPAVHVDSFVAALITALVLGGLNLIAKPILTILTLPITMLTMGLFMLVINVALIWVADYLVPGFSVDGILMLFLFGFVVSVLNSVFNKVIGED